MEGEPMIQRTEEWHLARCGKVTASRVHDIMATTKSGGFTAGRKNYMAELVTERLTGEPPPKFVSAAMANGTECEPEARAAYVRHASTMIKAVSVEEVGFVEHPTIVNAGCSPDGLVGGDGLIEMKCPNTATHLDTLLHRKIPIEYIHQMQFQMACIGRMWCDYVSYDKRLPEPMRLFVHRVPRDDKLIASIELQVTQFLIDLDATVDLLRKRYMAEAPSVRDGCRVLRSPSHEPNACY